jgi:hypothetical protein
MATDLDGNLIRVFYSRASSSSFLAADIPASSFPDFWSGMQGVAGAKFRFYACRPSSDNATATMRDPKLWQISTTSVGGWRVLKGVRVGMLANELRTPRRYPHRASILCKLRLTPNYRRSVLPASAPPRQSAPRLCHGRGGELEQIQFTLGHASVHTTERHIGCKPNLREAVNDRFENLSGMRCGLKKSRANDCALLATASFIIHYRVSSRKQYLDDCNKFISNLVSGLPQDLTGIVLLRNFT